MPGAHEKKGVSSHVVLKHVLLPARLRLTKDHNFNMVLSVYNIKKAVLNSFFMKILKNMV